VYIYVQVMKTAGDHVACMIWRV